MHTEAMANVLLYVYVKLTVELLYWHTDVRNYSNPLGK